MDIRNLIESSMKPEDETQESGSMYGICEVVLQEGFASNCSVKEAETLATMSRTTDKTSSHNSTDAVNKCRVENCCMLGTSVLGTLEQTQQQQQHGASDTCAADVLHTSSCVSEGAQSDAATAFATDVMTGSLKRANSQEHNSCQGEEVSAGSSQTMFCGWAHESKCPHKCQECGKEYTTSAHLQRHHLVHTGQLRFQCTQCGKAFGDSWKLARHERTHSGERPFQCNECGKPFADSWKLARHQRAHAGLHPFQCRHCNKTFADSWKLARHERVHTGVADNYQVETSLLQRTAALGKLLQVQVQTDNSTLGASGSAPMAAYSDKVDASGTKAVTNPQRSSSSEGDETPAGPSQRAVCRGTLGNERPFKCQECGNTYTSSAHLQRHVSVHTGLLPFQCTECGKAFRDSWKLARHERIHTGQRPFKCKECGKAFADSWKLARHERVHTGERPFQCTQCGRTFTQSWNLATHKLMHTGEQPFRCTQCGKAFTTSSHLAKHVRLHAGEQLLPVLDL